MFRKKHTLKTCAFCYCVRTLFLMFRKKHTHETCVFCYCVRKGSKKGKPTKRQPRRDVFPLFPPRAPPFFPFPLLRKRFYARGQKRANKPPNAFPKPQRFGLLLFVKPFFVASAVPHSVRAFQSSKCFGLAQNGGFGISLLLTAKVHCIAPLFCLLRSGKVGAVWQSPPHPPAFDLFFVTG